MSLGELYISSSINENTNVRYWTFQKSDVLDIFMANIKTTT